MDGGLRDRMRDKIEEGDFAAADLPEYLNLFCELCNESEDAQEEVAGWNRVMQLALIDREGIWLEIQQGRLSCGAGHAEKPDTVLSLNGDVAAAVLTGEKDATAAFNAGLLSVEGALSDAIKLRSLIEIVRDELEA